MRYSLPKFQNFMPAAALAILVVAGSPAVALARGSNDTTEVSGSTNVATTSSTSGGSTTTSTTETSHVESETSAQETSTTEVKSSAETNHHNNQLKAEKMVTELKTEHKPPKTDAEREKSCDAHKTGIETKFASIARNSLAYETRVDGIYAKALTFQTDNKLNPTGIADLIATANTAQLAAKASVATLQSAKPTAVDCTSKTVSTDVAAFKTAAAQARHDLKAYKQAVKAVLVSLRQASHPAETKTDSTTSTTTTTTTPTTTKPAEGTNN